MQLKYRDLLHKSLNSIRSNLYDEETQGCMQFFTSNHMPLLQTTNVNGKISD